MHEVLEQTIQCPYCGESIKALIDCSSAEQNYIEDCQVCCCPIEFDVVVDHLDEVSVTVRRDNE